MEALPWIASQESRLIKQLETWCNINSGSSNLNGLTLMKKQLIDAFLPLSDHQHLYTFPPVETYSMQGARFEALIGDALYFQKRPHLKRRILLCGHMDTVYPSTSSFQTVHSPEPGIMVGPGVADMKGGLLVILAALQAFEQTTDAQNLGWDLLINTDEEIGSLSSSSCFAELAKTNQAALIFEPTTDKQGTFARARKGSGKLTLLAKGKAAHAGRAFKEGKNAIILLAHALTELDKLNGKRTGLTLNTGLIQGGEALNQVPAQAIAKVDIRFENQADTAWVESQVQSICNSFSRPPLLVLSYECQFHRPVKSITPKTERLFTKIQQAGKILGLNIQWQDSGGCCDGNNFAALGLPVIDTLGVRGGNIHTEQEFICLESIVERASLTTLLLQDLAQGGLEAL